MPLADIAQAEPGGAGLLVVPATIDLAGAEIELVSVVARENRLRKALARRVDRDPRRRARTGSTTSSSTARRRWGCSRSTRWWPPTSCCCRSSRSTTRSRGSASSLETVELVRANLNPRAGDLHGAAHDVRRPHPAVGRASPTRCGSTSATGCCGPRSPGRCGSRRRPATARRVMTYDPTSPGALSYREAAREMATQGSAGMNRPTSRQRRGLGRGLGSLIPTARPPSSRDADDPAPEPSPATADWIGRAAPPTVAADAGGPRRTPSPPRRPAPSGRARRTPLGGRLRRTARPTPADDALEAAPGGGRVLRRAAGRRDRARTRGSRARSSTRRRWPSSSTRSGRSGCSSRSWCAATGAGPLRADHGRAPAGGPPRGRAGRRSRRSCADTGDDAMLRDALLENLHRAQLNPLEEAAAYQQLLDDFGCTHEELAGRIGRSRPQISNTLRLLKLSPAVQRRVAAGVLSAGHARTLLARRRTRRPQDRLADAGGRRGHLGARPGGARRRRRARARDQPERPPARPSRSPRTAVDLAERLSDLLDTRVKVDVGSHQGPDHHRVRLASRTSSASSRRMDPTSDAADRPTSRPQPTERLGRLCRQVGDQRRPIEQSTVSTAVGGSTATVERRRRDRPGGRGVRYSPTSRAVAVTGTPASEWPEHVAGGRERDLERPRERVGRVLDHPGLHRRRRLADQLDRPDHAVQPGAAARRARSRAWPRSPGCSRTSSRRSRACSTAGSAGRASCRPARPRWAASRSTRRSPRSARPRSSTSSSTRRRSPSTSSRSWRRRCPRSSTASWCGSTRSCGRTCRRGSRRRSIERVRAPAARRSSARSPTRSASTSTSCSTRRSW